MTHSEIVAVALLPFAFAFSTHKAPIVSIALALAFIANLAYANGTLAGESIRWVSALVGLAGAVEFGRGVERVKARKPVSIPDALRKVDGGTWIGCVAMASMGVDGFGMIAFREFGVWIVPEMTIGILYLVVLLGVFGKENER